MVEPQNDDAESVRRKMVEIFEGEGKEGEEILASLKSGLPRPTKTEQRAIAEAVASDIDRKDAAVRSKAKELVETIIVGIIACGIYDLLKAVGAYAIANFDGAQTRPRENAVKDQLESLVDWETAKVLERNIDSVSQEVVGKYFKEQQRALKKAIEDDDTFDGVRARGGPADLVALQLLGEAAERLQRYGAKSPDGTS